MLRSCDQYPTLGSLRTYLLELFDIMKLKVFHMWQKYKKFCTMMQFNSIIEEFVDEICKQAKFLCEHHYIRSSPATYLEHCKSTLPEENALILLDFAENYSFIIQDVFQDCHWINSQATLHLVIIYEKNRENLTHESVCIT